MTNIARELIESMIASGDLSPAARDMAPEDVFQQYAEANALDEAERRDLYARADLTMDVAVENLVEGDLADLEPLLEQWGARDEKFEADLIVAQDDYATVETTGTNTDGSVTIFTDQMNLAVPAGTSVKVLPVRI